MLDIMDPKTCMLLASVTCLSFDYILTFRREVELVWSRPPAMGTLLFVLSRYLPFVDLSLIVNTFTASNTIKGCYVRIVASTWIQLLGISTAETILTLRTIAIWRRNPYIMAGLGLLNTVAFGSSIFFTFRYLQTVRPAQRLGSTGCYLEYVDQVIFGDFIVVLICESVVVILTVVRALYYLRNSNASWVHQLYRKGILYFIATLVFSLLNVFLPLFLKDSSKRLLFIDPQRAAHSIFCNRVLFLIFSQKQAGQETTSSRGEDPHEKTSFFPTVMEMTLDSLATPQDDDMATISEIEMREPEP
ncbi:hypothetical protein CPB83DRAFT_899154 [Crepidotus variabilis]|uniref:DUF6533 domain-containing protein n=1 Tax=Crepidotus variabilis TaxID=179855 RepID=A0A9P6E5N8_9AGAR|nr:hypothetical protein CPB83DRAFT_899154 [Crepidotus variabilis]